MADPVLLRGHEGSIHAVEVASHRSKTLAVSGGYDDTVRFWDLNGSELRTIAFPATVRALSSAQAGPFAVATLTGIDLVDFE